MRRGKEREAAADEGTLGEGSNQASEWANQGVAASSKAPPDKYRSTFAPLPSPTCGPACVRTAHPTAAGKRIRRWSPARRPDSGGMPSTVGIVSSGSANSCEPCPLLTLGLGRAGGPSSRGKAAL